MTDDPEMLPLPPAQSSMPSRLPEPAAAQDIAAEPAPAAPAGRADESKQCEEEQPEEKMKTDTQMDDVEEEREAPVPRKRGRPPTRHLPTPYSEGYTPPPPPPPPPQLRWMHREDLLSHQIVPTP